MKQNSQRKNKSPQFGLMSLFFFLTYIFSLQIKFLKALSQFESFIMLGPHHPVIQGKYCLLQIADREERSFGNKDGKKAEKRRAKGKDKQ